MLSEEVVQKYMRAGKIASKVRSIARKLVKPGTPIIQICDTVETSIIAQGGKPAFPCNVCINEVAAHYSSPPGDTRTIPRQAVVKIDLGVSVDGYIADTATTVSLSNEYDGMVVAVEKALSQVIKSIRPAVKTTHLGEIIQKTITQFGFKPIWNLSGHQMRRYILHTGKSIPNAPRFTMSKLNEGEVFAVEPFLTLPSGSGEVYGTDEAYIYRLQRVRSTRNPRVKQLMEKLKTEYRSLPFSQRWLSDWTSMDDNAIFHELIRMKSVMAYPTLVEKKGQIVTQAEHTVIVTKDGCRVTTL